MKTIKYFLMLTVLVATLPSMANTLNMPNSDCAGSGILVSDPYHAFDIKFTSKRSFHDGRVSASSTVTVLGAAKTVTALLYFKQINATQYNVMDMTAVSKAKPAVVVGQATCDARVCRFTAKVASAGLYLDETWQRTEKGFAIIKGHQMIFGVQSNYTANFNCTSL